MIQSDRTGSRNPNWRDAARRVCAGCGAEFKRYNATAKYCTHACYTKDARRRREASGPRHRTPQPVCKRCGEAAPYYRALCDVCARPTPTTCKSCGTPVSRLRTWCMRCRLLGRHCSADPHSICTVCSARIDGVRYRKYCDRCWRASMHARRGAPRKVDANQAEIVDALRRVGCSVWDISATGGGVPDLLVRLPSDVLVLVEVKNPLTRGKLNALQQKFHQEWAGVVHVVQTVDEVLRLVGAR